MLSTRKPSSDKKPISPPSQDKSTKKAIHVVFTATVTMATMKRSEQHVIGMFENLSEAEVIEKKFNEQAKEVNGNITKAFTIRYSIPYTAPIIKQMLENSAQ